MTAEPTHNMIHISSKTSTDELCTVLEHVLGALRERIGTAALAGTLFGTAVLMTVEDQSDEQ